MKKLIVDVDMTITQGTGANGYTDALVDVLIVEKLRQYKKEGFTIVLNTSRNMKTFKNNIGKINKYTLPILIEWLNQNDIPYDEIYVGKPWCGDEGFYIDDKAIRPSEFIKYSYDEILLILQKETHRS